MGQPSRGDAYDGCNCDSPGCCGDACDACDGDSYPFTPRKEEEEGYRLRPRRGRGPPGAVTAVTGVTVAYSTGGRSRTRVRARLQNSWPALDPRPQAQSALVRPRLRLNRLWYSPLATPAPRRSRKSPGRSQVSGYAGGSRSALESRSLSRSDAGAGRSAVNATNGIIVGVASACFGSDFCPEC